MAFDALDAYRRMYLIRKTEERIAAEYPKGRMRLPVHFSFGQEAAAVGVMMALQEGDHVFASHRSHHPYLGMGGSVTKMVAELYGRREGSSTGGVGGSMYLTDPECGFMGSFAIVGDCISVATGAALAFKQAQSSQVAVAYFGDAAVETGQFWESLNFAATHKLPILYVCENNGYATQTPIEQRQPQTTMPSRVRPFMPARTVFDYQVAVVHDAAAMMRRLLLPAFLEIETSRYREHVGPNYDHELGYRSREEVEAAEARDPLKALEAQFDQHRDLKPVWTSVNEQVREAFDAVLEVS